MSEQDAHDAEESTAGESSAQGESADAGDANRADGDDANRADDDDASTEAATDERSADRTDKSADEVVDEVVEEESVEEESVEEETVEEASDRDVDPSLVERVTESDPEDLARELASLRTRIDGLEGELEATESEIDDLTSKLKRKQADFQNYKKRMEKRREEEKRRAAEDLVTRLLDVRDNLARALDQDEDTDIRGGVESTLRQFDDVLAEENVEVVEPEPGAEVDPHRHEVLVRVESDQPEDTIAEVHRPGYEMADAVLREAQVTVSDGDDE